ncbi:DUF167 domain-containing protein [Ktedonobacter racemifer]|uniref:UPF0235 protein Krac_12052 n=1 Tax=Ktedonobacter racemifer DSM 44963 TaxID=485913 RepID=D6TF31_KTERA|nr:DUF167 domain-containing protein [Ktedonobacter racemifer]EFH90431.1 protein of unknown function DUF167 [Ktedonobacter racemifer DSM 44963]
MQVPVRVIPRSNRNTLEWEEGAIKARLTAPPVDGAANAALIALLAETLSLPKRAITLIRGTTGRQKIVEIEGLEQVEIIQRLSASSQKKQ